MNDAMFTEGPETGCPILERAVAYLEYKVSAIHDVCGNHNITGGWLERAVLNLGMQKRK